MESSPSNPATRHPRTVMIPFMLPLPSYFCHASCIRSVPSLVLLSCTNILPSIWYVPSLSSRHTYIFKPHIHESLYYSNPTYKLCFFITSKKNATNSVNPECLLSCSLHACPPIPAPLIIVCSSAPPPPPPVLYVTPFLELFSMDQTQLCQTVIRTCKHTNTPLCLLYPYYPYHPGHHLLYLPFLAPLLLPLTLIGPILATFFCPILFVPHLLLFLPLTTYTRATPS